MRDSPDPPMDLPPGYLEEKLQVDRKRLEAMITGRAIQGSSIYLPNAQEFFDKVQNISGATVCWPSKLKIGAKTKKDPYVKIIGPPPQVESAKQLISATLQVKRDRVTLKMEIPHCVHSHIIGRGGRGSQSIMKLTGCHVHFPDSNKYSEDTTKSDQVSIAGPPLQVEEARRMLREMSPVCISFDVPWFYSQPPPMPQFPTDLSVVLRKSVDSLFCCTIRGSMKQELLIVETANKIATAFHVPNGIPIIGRLAVEVRHNLQMVLTTADVTQRLERLAAKFGVRVQCPVAGGGDSLVFVVGPVNGLLIIKKFIMGLLPVSVQFEQLHPMSSDITSIEKELRVAIGSKRKTIQGVDQTMFIIKSPEENMVNVLLARQRVLGLEENEQLFDEYAFMKDQQEEPTFSKSLVGRGNAEESNLAQSEENPKSPDPENSPIAHSLLKGAKDINKNNDLWSSKPSALRMSANRETMLLKANQAVYDSSDSHARYPTDLWSGYGFSNSLPADLLKGMLDLRGGFDDNRDLEDRKSSSPPLTRGLTSVREEDELSDLSASLSSSSLSSRFLMNRVFNTNTHKQRQAFSASTSIFESPIGNDFIWDIRVFVDPAMVLAQLGCSEYLAQLRDQEIDMTAFLLLDEQALKDVGVATVGARKKIHHAILKLRESAKANGYSL